MDQLHALEGQQQQPRQQEQPQKQLQQQQRQQEQQRLEQQQQRQHGPGGGAAACTATVAPTSSPGPAHPPGFPGHGMLTKTKLSFELALPDGRRMPPALYRTPDGTTHVRCGAPTPPNPHPPTPPPARPPAAIPTHPPIYPPTPHPPRWCGLSDAGRCDPGGPMRLHLGHHPC